MEATDLVLAISIGAVVVLALSAAGVFGRRGR